MKPRLTVVSSHVRRAPIDRFEAIRFVKTAQLYEEIHGNHMAEMLAKALDEAFAEDDGLAGRCMEGM